MSTSTERLPLPAMPPALLALMAQIVAVAVVTAASQWHDGEVAGAIPVILIGLLTALFCRLLRLPLWWQFIGLGFVPMLWLALQGGLDPTWYLAGFALLAATSLGSIRTRVPLYLSSPQAAAALATRLPEGGRLLDLGCGLGGPLARLAALRPDVRLSGVEAAPLNWLVARLRLAGRAHIKLGSLWEADLAQYDVVYAYLSPAPMPRLWEKARREMRPGSLLISNTFAIPGVEADETVELGDLSHARLLIWRMR